MEQKSQPQWQGQGQFLRVFYTSYLVYPHISLPDETFSLYKLNSEQVVLFQLVINQSFFITARPTKTFTLTSCNFSRLLSFCKERL